MNAPRQRNAPGSGVPPPRPPGEDGAPPATGTGADRGPGVRAHLTTRAAATQQRFQQSTVGHLWDRLRLLDFINRGTLFAGVLLLCLVPFVITLRALEGRDAATSFARHFGLDRQAAADVDHAFSSPAVASHAVTGTSWVWFVLGGIGAAAALQQLYEQAFDLPGLGWRGTHRQVGWLLIVIALGVLGNQVGPWLNGHLPVYFLVSLIGGVAFWWVTMWWLLAGRRSWRRLFPSALVTGVCWLAVATYFRLSMSGTIHQYYALYGTIGVAFAIMSLLIAIGIVVILGALAGIVWQERHGEQTSPPFPAESAGETASPDPGPGAPSRTGAPPPPEEASGAVADPRGRRR